MFIIEDLKENILGLKHGNKYMIYKSTKNNRKVYLKGVFLEETGANNELYLFESGYGFKECYQKVDFLIGVYEIKEISKKAS